MLAINNADAPFRHVDALELDTLTRAQAVLLIVRMRRCFQDDHPSRCESRRVASSYVVLRPGNASARMLTTAS